MKVLVADNLAKEGVDLLKDNFEVDVRLKLKPEELVSIIGDYDALAVRSDTKATAEVIEAGKKLQIIARAGVGIDNIDVEAATRKGVLVVNTPLGNTIAAAEHTIALMLAEARHIPQAQSSLKSGKWERGKFVGVELKGKTLGIMGLGNVGSEVARRARSFQMQLLVYDPFVSLEYASKLGAKLVTLEELLQASDFVTLHLPVVPQTRGIIGAKELAMMKPSAHLINVARGALVDEEALSQAVTEGKIAGAAVDVFSTEPATDNPLVKNDKIVVTPHLGASTEEAQTGVSTDAAEQITAVLQGQPARYAVNASPISAETSAILAPFINLAALLGKLTAQLCEGQTSHIDIEFNGEIEDYDTSPLKAAALAALLEMTSEERVNLINSSIIAQSRGLQVTEHKSATCENYSRLISFSATTSAGTTTVAGTILRGEPHIVRVNDYWIDLVPTGKYLLFGEHLDRPGLVGAVGTITGKANVDISFMQLSRLKPRGQALMVLALDEFLDKEQQQEILAIPDVYSVKVVQL